MVVCVVEVVAGFLAVLLEPDFDRPLFRRLAFELPEPLL